MRFFAIIKKPIGLAILFTFVLFTASDINAQERKRVVKKDPKVKTNKQTPRITRPTATVPGAMPGKHDSLTSDIVIVKKQDKPASRVKKTASSRSTLDTPPKRSLAYSATTHALMLQSIRAKIGLRYSYASVGPRTFDCSGFVWKVFQESGITFTRTSARNYWKTFPPVYGDDRFEFGTLVFFNHLGHVGIVADEKGFYHASTSKGITYTRFEGYWSKRIVGYRRVPVSSFPFAESIEN